MLRRLAILFLVTCIGCIATGCIAPPEPKSARILQPTEWDYSRLVARAEKFVSGNDFVKAEMLLRQAIALDAAKPGVWNDLGYVAMRQNRYLEADKHFLKALAIDPKHFPTQVNRARLAFETEDFEKAIERYEAVLARLDAGDKMAGLDSARVETDLSTAYFAVGRYDEAVCHAEQAYSVSRSPGVLTQLMRMLFVAERTPRALELGRDFQEHPTRIGFADVMFDLGVALYQTGDVGGSRAAFELVLASPEAPKTLQRDARVLITAGGMAGQKSLDPQTVQFLEDSRSSLCGATLPETFRYWPSKTFEDAKKLTEVFCHEQPVSS